MLLVTYYVKKMIPTCSPDKGLLVPLVLETAGNSFESLRPSRPYLQEFWAKLNFTFGSQSVKNCSPDIDLVMMEPLQVKAGDSLVLHWAFLSTAHDFLRH